MVFVKKNVYVFLVSRRKSMPKIVGLVNVQI